ncbi:MAG: hypothetical protein A3B79_00875 [Deltaproteobacteria bacterium RIFCSPHIGHO2_02_FULL_50_15]|nr:MAG: hypothetical protein A3B79_00875 [Deltaproteobacteria bacterium RIFCSPHIGHO2_02_FULL_50_15]
MKENVILKDVYAIAEGDHSQKSRWTKIGIGFVNSDTSINVVLDAIPVNGRLHIRDRHIRKSSNSEAAPLYGAK